ncbi:hypothetical protein [Acinetobacter sp.]|uniref:hypothetical protein n=1 Tax=Acinetobacter sp. TaxID=472 RepID=UPI003D06B8E4
MSYVPNLVRRGEGNFRDVYRPMRFDELVGPAAAIAKPFVTMLGRKGKIDNHAIIFEGESGSGKTTLAYLLGLAMNCENPQENKTTGAKVEPCLECISCRATLNGGLRNTNISTVLLHNSSTVTKDQIADLVKDYIMGPRSIHGAKVNVSIFDEAHKLTKEQQSVLLTPLEALPSHSYVFLTTNEGGKFKGGAIESRFTRISIPEWGMDDLKKLITDVIFVEHTKNGRPKMSLEAIHYIAFLAEGNARRALMVLQHIMDGFSYNDGQIIDVDYVKSQFSDPNDTEVLEKDWVNLSDLFTAFYSNDIFKAVTRLEELEKSREVTPVELTMKINKFLKNRIYKAVQSRNQKEVMEFSTKLARFGQASAVEGEAYSRLLYAVIYTLTK